MVEKIKRARVITRVVLRDISKRIPRFDGGDPAASKRVGLKLSNGVGVTFEFVDLQTVLSLLDDPVAARVAGDDWVTLTLRVGQQVKMQLRYCQSELELLAYQPGQWERWFGVDPDGDTMILYPEAIRRSGVLPADHRAR